MGATSVTGVGLGAAGLKVAPVSNVNHVLFANASNDGDTIGDDITVVFVRLDDADFDLNLPDANKSVGKSILFRSRSGGYTASLHNIYGTVYNFASSYVHFNVISDGENWTISSWYNDD